MNVKLIAKTIPVVEGLTTGEDLLSYCARVSNPKNQLNTETADKLLKYCFKAGHVSIFEQASLTLEIQTSRAISAQILRHRSFCFQEFSQRYAEVTEFETYNARRQDTKNRQNSIDDMSEDTKREFYDMQVNIQDTGINYYEHALSIGIAKEQARFLLPLSTSTTLYMTGNIRSWIHYCKTRCDPSTQLEHREIADECKKILLEQYPVLEKLLTQDGGDK